MAIINSYVDQYCDLGGLDIDNPKRPVAYSHIGGQVSLIKIEGVKSILSTNEMEHLLAEMFGSSGVSPLFRKKGHSLSISFERHFNTDEDISEIIEKLKEKSRIKGLKIDAITNEYAEILKKNILIENILLACWTLPTAAFPDEIKPELEQKKTNERLFFSKAKDAMSPFLNLNALDAAHDAFVAHIMDALASTKIKAKLLEPSAIGERPDLAEIRRGIFFHETPKNWHPLNTIERKYNGVIKPDDFSQMFAPPLSRQILSSSASTSKNFRELDIGSRTYTTMAFGMFGREVRPFNELLASINTGDAAKMPFRITFHWEYADLKITAKRILSGLLKWAGSINANYFDNIRILEAEHNRDTFTIVDARVVACTWSEPYENKDVVINQRRSLLTRALARWGNPIIADTPSNPMRAVAETVAGMTMRSITKPATQIPAGAYATMMPFHRTAGVFDDGETVFLSLDKTIIKHEVFSTKQNFWLTLILATPGSGKSVLMNRLNLDMAAYAGGSSLPYIGIIDVGVSSSGFINLLKNALPAGREHEVAYTILQNTSESAINPFDLGLGRRQPLEREKTFILQFLQELLRLDEKTSILATHILRTIYIYSSDMVAVGSPKLYQPNVDKIIDDSLQLLSDKNVEFTITNRTTWWFIVDLFAKNGEYQLAIRAQRYASPVMQDISRVLADPTTVQDFGEELVQNARNALMDAVERYPIFSNPTTIDIDVARIVSIDLQEVIQRNTATESAKRTNTLMYMLARQLFVTKIAGYEKELANIKECVPREAAPIYVKYWAKIYADMKEVHKRLCMDEYHLTNGSQNITEMVMADAREGRKWGLEIILASQLLSDFKKMTEMASTVFILNSENAEALKAMQDTFGFDDAVKDNVKRYLTGSRGAEGANFLARYKSSDQEQWLILNNRLGATEIWALTTKKEDRLIRDALYERLSSDKALEFLSYQYPQGTALSLWRRIESENVREDDESLIDRLMNVLMEQYAQYELTISKNT